MNKFFKLVAMLILVVMVTTVFVNASVLFMGYAGVSIASMLYGIGVLSMIVIEGHALSKQPITIGLIVSAGVVATTSLLGVALYLFSKLPAFASVRDYVVITPKEVK